MTRLTVPYHPAASAVCLLFLSATGGCAHFHDAEVRAQQRAAVEHPEPRAAQAVPQPLPPPESPPPLLAAAPTPPLAPPTEIPAPPAAPATHARVASTDGGATSSTPAPEVPTPPAPSPVPYPGDRSATSRAPATADAVIIFANTPAAHCTTCETLKLSVAPSGQVLIERGSWTPGHGAWRYKRSRAYVGPARAAAFAASLTADRPVGRQTLGSAACAAPTGDAGLSIEWIEADRDDRLTAAVGCSGSQSAERLRHAPDLLGLPHLALP